MTQNNELNEALQAHTMWKITLKSAIQMGSLKTPIEDLRNDKLCDFGAWLYGVTITEQLKKSAHYRKILKLHATFHEKTAMVGHLAVTGKKAEAENMMALNGDFTLAANELAKAMMAWSMVEK